MEDDATEDSNGADDDDDDDDGDGDDDDDDDDDAASEDTDGGYLRLIIFSRRVTAPIDSHISFLRWRWFINDLMPAFSLHSSRSSPLSTTGKAAKRAM
jgi:hypothetical protein